jgi:hypothetical protein
LFCVLPLADGIWQVCRGAASSVSSCDAVLSVLVILSQLLSHHQRCCQRAGEGWGPEWVFAFEISSGIPYARLLSKLIVTDAAWPCQVCCIAQSLLRHLAITAQTQQCAASVAAVSALLYGGLWSQQKQPTATATPVVATETADRNSHACAMHCFCRGCRYQLVGL